MKAEINVTGILVVTPQTSVEALALRAWMITHGEGRDRRQQQVRFDGYEEGLRDGRNEAERGFRCDPPTAPDPEQRHPLLPSQLGEFRIDLMIEEG